jgi:hypothetical protein
VGEQVGEDVEHLGLDVDDVAPERSSSASVSSSTPPKR